MTDFDRALAITLEAEGGFVDHPNDRGGATNFGVTQRVYDQWRADHDLDLQSVRHIGEGEVKAIYYEYWLASGAPLYSWPLNAIMFDMAVNHGPKTAAKLLQGTLGVPKDGVQGPVTQQAVADLAVDSLTNEVLWDRVERYRQLARTPGQDVFLSGWLWRVRHLREELGLNEIKTEYAD